MLLFIYHFSELSDNAVLTTIFTMTTKAYYLIIVLIVCPTCLKKQIYADLIPQIAFSYIMCQPFKLRRFELFSVSLKSPGGGSVFTSEESTALFLFDKISLFALCCICMSHRTLCGV